MPKYAVEDLDTGISFELEGDGEPSDEDAEAASNQIVELIKKSTKTASGNRYFVDMGPLQELYNATSIIDSYQQKDYDFNETMIDVAMMKKASARATAMYDELDKRGVPFKERPGWKEIYDRQLNMLREEHNSTKESRPIRKTWSDHVPENSLVILMHGNKKGGLYADSGENITLKNIASVLGSSATNVHNIANLACFGGLCKPEDYASVFPGVTNILQTNPEIPNTISIGRINNGQFFYEDTDPIRFNKAMDNWSSNRVSPKSELLNK